MSELSENQQPTIPPAETVEPPIPYEDKQIALGKEWAAIYSDPNRELTNSAEIVLRNPQVYSREIDKYNLPEDLRAEWKNLSDFIDSVSTIAAKRQLEWGNFHGLDRIQPMVFRGDVKPDFRGTVGDIMRISSELFSKSVKIVPGNTEYYKGNVVAAESWIEKYRQPQPINIPKQE